MGGRREKVLEKILARVEVCPESGCWLWTGPSSGGGRGGGYPRMWLDGQTVAVHIVMWTHFNGYKPGKKQLDHICRTRRCVHPDHLELVSHAENQARRALAHAEAPA